MKKAELENLRWNLAVLIARCTCYRVANHEMECHPTKCYPDIIKLLYPKGGFNLKSWNIPCSKRKKLQMVK